MKSKNYKNENQSKSEMRYFEIDIKYDVKPKIIIFVL